MKKQQIIDYSKKIGIDLIGFTNAKIFEGLKAKLVLQQELGYACEFQTNDIEARINPYKLLSSCKAIIAIALAYPGTCNQLKELSKDEVYFSSSSWGTDYHHVLNEKMQKLMDYIGQFEPSLEYKIICDTSPLCDRTIAYEAGLGFFGRNNLLINPVYGSRIFLGAVLTNLDIESDIPLQTRCDDNCDKCVDACPTGALDYEGLLDSNKCLSYITQKKELTDEEEAKINQCIYGCDICMNVCPYNKKKYDHHKELQPQGIEFIKVKDYEFLSNKKFKAKYGILSGSWRGAKIINRNIKIYKEKKIKE